MVIGTQASGALVLATAHQAQRHAYGASGGYTPPGSASSAVHGLGLFYLFKAGMGLLPF